MDYKINFDNLVPKHDGPAKAVVTINSITDEKDNPVDTVPNSVLKQAVEENFLDLLTIADFFGHQNFMISVVKDEKQILYLGPYQTKNF